jgi:SAM-dependent methyltransferase
VSRREPPPRCRSCAAPLERVFVDLGMCPLANALLDAAVLGEPEPRYPLRAYVCSRCLLVQLGASPSPEQLFTDYPYFSSYSDTWVEHARRFADASVSRFRLGSSTLVLEVASNDGYLLRHFRERGIPVLGVDPAANVAAAAEQLGIRTVVAFFGRATARRLVDRHGPAALVIANNVLAHVPDLHDFVDALHIVLARGGVLSAEFPHVLRLIEECQFDTIYHEHVSYLSLVALEPILEAHGLAAFDVDVLPTHGGSLRLFVCRAEENRRPTARLRAVRLEERRRGLAAVSGYLGVDERARVIRDELRSFLRGARLSGKRTVAYGAAAKGVTLLNACGVEDDLIDYVVDRSPHKQGRYLPGVRLPIRPPEAVAETRPDYLLILPWNLAEEIVDQMSWVRGFGCRFVTPIPRLELR